jgi:hypothetical protein
MAGTFMTTAGMAAAVSLNHSRWQPSQSSRTRCILCCLELIHMQCGINMTM